MGIAGGFITVVFFSFWGHAYGRRHLGRIQGAAQTLTVVASALGPLFLAEWVERTGSYAVAFYVLAAIVVVLGVVAGLVSIPPGAQSASRNRVAIPAATLLERIDTNTAPTIVDVRTVKEFSQGHVPGAEHSIPKDRRTTRDDPGLAPGPHRRLLRSRTACLDGRCGASRHGFTDVRYLAGHFSKWQLLVCAKNCSSICRSNVNGQRSNVSQDGRCPLTYLSGDRMRKIDVFNHIFPARYVERMMELASTMKDVGKRVRGVPMLANLDVRFEIMDAHPGYQQILSIATPPVDAFASPATPPILRNARTTGWRSSSRDTPTDFPASSPRCRWATSTRRCESSSARWAL